MCVSAEAFLDRRRSYGYFKTLLKQLKTPEDLRFTKKVPNCDRSSYISKTNILRYSTQNLFIAFKKPPEVVTTKTLSCWLKETLKNNGIDTKLFSAYSSRHASTSANKRNGITVDLIRNSAGWMKNSATFADFYNRPISQDRTEFTRSKLDS